MRSFRLALASLVALPALGGAQTPTSSPAFDLSIRNIMRGPELYGRAPSNERWSADGRWIYFQWNPPGTDWREPMRPYRVRAEEGAQPERLTTAQADSAAPYVAVGTLSPDHRSRAVEALGDIWLVSPRDGSARRLTQTVATESRPTFSAEGRTVYFVGDGNANSVSLADGMTRQRRTMASCARPAGRTSTRASSTCSSG